MNILPDILHFMSKYCKLLSLITQEVINEKIFYYSVLESSQNKLQEYAMKNR